MDDLHRDSKAIDSNAVDSKAVARLKRGDIKALDILIERYQVRAVRVAYLITQDAALAQDVVQDVFLSIYRSIRTFDPRRPFAPWLLRSVVNAAVRAAQHSRRYDSLEDSADDPGDDGGEGLTGQLADQSALPEDLIEGADLEQQIWKALGVLTPERRTIIILKFYLELSEIEMAEQLSIPIGTVKSRLFTAKKQLRELLQINMEV